MSDIKEFERLWTIDKDKYHIEILDGIFYIMDKNNMMLLVEDDKLYYNILQKMINNNSKVLEGNCNNDSLNLVPFQQVVRKFKDFQNNNNEVTIKIIWRKDISIQKQLFSLKNNYAKFSQIPISELYKIAKDNNLEWEFTKMRFVEAKKWVDIVQKQGLNVEIVK